MKAHPIYEAVLPASGLMPLTRQDDALSQSPVPYSGYTIHPRTGEERDALSAWINTHQAMFYTVGAACVSIVAGFGALKLPDPTTAIALFKAAAALRLSSAAYTSLPGLKLEMYEAYVRPTMLESRPGFSGVSSREAIAFAALLNDIQSFLRNSRETEDIPSLRNALEHILVADDCWWKHHALAMRTLVQRPVSLAQEEYRKRVHGGRLGLTFQEFKEATLQSTDASDNYDRYFGIRRAAIVGHKYYEARCILAYEMARPYTDQEGVLATYRDLTLPALAVLRLEVQ